MLPTNVNPLVYVAEPNESSQIHSIIDINNFDVSITSNYNNTTNEYDTFIYIVNELNENVTLDVNQVTTTPQIVSNQITKIDLFLYEGNYTDFHVFDLSTFSSNYVFSNSTGTTTYGTTKDFLTFNNNKLYINSTIKNSDYSNGIYTTYIKLDNNIQQLNVFILQIVADIVYLNLNPLVDNLSNNILDISHILSNNNDYSNFHIADLYSNYFNYNVAINFKFCDIDGNNESLQSNFLTLQESNGITQLKFSSIPSTGIFITYIKSITDINYTITIQKIIIRILSDTTTLSEIMVSNLTDINPIVYKQYLINNFALQEYNTTYSIVAPLIDNISPTFDLNAPITIIPFKPEDTYMITKQAAQQLVTGRVLYLLGSVNDTLNLDVVGNNHRVTIASDGVIYNSVTYKINDVLVINGITLVVRFIGSAGLQIISNALIINTFFINELFTVSQNTSTHAQTVLDSYQYDYIMTANINDIWGGDMNVLFNNRNFQENTESMNGFNILLQTNSLAIDSLLSNNTISLSSLNSEIIAATAYNTLEARQTPLGLRFLEIIATKVFGHAKARAAIANDSDFYKRSDIVGSVMSQITNGINNAVVNKRNEIFNMYVAYDRIQDNNMDDVYTNAVFNFYNTEWSFPLHFIVNIADIGQFDLLNNGPNMGGTQFINGHMNVPVLLKFN
jgi:hypothetical protein